MPSPARPPFCGWVRALRPGSVVWKAQAVCRCLSLPWVQCFLPAGTSSPLAPAPPPVSPPPSCNRSQDDLAKRNPRETHVCRKVLGSPFSLQYFLVRLPHSSSHPSMVNIKSQQKPGSPGASQECGDHQLGFHTPPPLPLTPHTYFCSEDLPPPAPSFSLSFTPAHIC